jgi:hypothetical protein
MIFWGQSFAILPKKKIFKKRNSITNSLSTKKTFLKKRKIFFETFTQNRHNCLQYEKPFKIFILSYFEYRQIWPNIHMDH